MVPNGNVGEAVKNYVIEFDYPGPRSENPGDRPEADDALASADSIVELALDSSGLTWSHEYAWPDGSLFKRVASPLSKDEILSRLRVALSDTDIRIISIGHPAT